ncbi:hypothetical protein GF338_10215 [candidate division WOR-3 bacterium]|nr:hypothetical protein [candidate division WOR-3 bacterium]
MRKLLTIGLVAGFVILGGAVLGCGKLGGGGGGSDEVIEELEYKIGNLEEDVEVLTEVINELQTDFDDHMEEFHGEEVEEKEPVKPKSGGGSRPSTGGGGVKPPTSK